MPEPTDHDSIAARYAAEIDNRPWNALYERPPTTTVLYLTLNPIAAMVLGIVLLGEQLTAELVAGMALVLTGIMIGSGAYASVRQLDPGKLFTRISQRTKRPLTDP